MVNQQMLQGNWNEIKGKLRTKWGQLTDDDLTRFNGDVDQLVGTIQRKTGEARDSIEKFLDQLGSGGGSAVAQATEAIGSYAQKAAETVQEQYGQAADYAQHAFNDGYRQAEDMVKQRPAESLAVCFGAGLVAGLVVGLMMRSR